MNWTVRDLAEKAGVHRNTVTRAETDETQHGHAVAQIMRTFESAGVIFVEENGAGPGVRLMKHITMQNWSAAAAMPIGARVIATTGDSDALGRLSKLGFSDAGRSGGNTIMRRDLWPVGGEQVDYGGSAMHREVKVGDFVKFRDDRMPPDIRNAGKVGQVLGHGVPPSANVIYVRFPNGSEYWVDRGTLVLAPDVDAEWAPGGGQTQVPVQPRPNTKMPK